MKTKIIIAMLALIIGIASYTAISYWYGIKLAVLIFGAIYSNNLARSAEKIDNKFKD